MFNLTSVSITLTWLSGLVFIIYGFLCLFAGGMTKEFERYGLSKFRRLVGLLELAGGVGCLIGLKYPPLLIISTGGLTTLMILGTLVRLRLKDRLILILPALILLVINAIILKISLLG